MQSIEFKVIKYAPIVIGLITYIGFLIGIENQSVLFSSLLVGSTLSLAGLLWNDLKKGKHGSPLFLIWLTLETSGTIVYALQHNGISLMAVPSYYLMATFVGRAFAPGKKDNNLIHLYCSIGAISVIATNAWMMNNTNQVAFDYPTYMEEMYTLLWVVLFILIHWRRNVLVIGGLQKDKKSSENQLEVSNKVLSLIGHNIRTPLTNLSLQLQIAKRAEPNNERYGQLNESVKKLIDITEATIVKNKPISESGASAIEMVQQIQKIYADRIILDVQDKVYFHYSEKLSELFLCLQNVMDNALHWSIDQKPVLHISVKGSSLCFLLKDGGRGMSFSTFSQYGSKDISGLNLHGKGIGMHYSIQLLKQAGFNFHIRTREGVGTHILLANDSKYEMNFLKDEGWLYKSFYSGKTQESLVVDKTAFKLN